MAGRPASPAPERGVAPVALDAAEHPASRAWRRLHPHAPPPRAVRTLQEKAKGAAYRLAGVAPDGGDVVAKRSTPARIGQERAIYEQVLPGLDVTVPRWFGALDDPAAGCAWLFVEEAAGEAYDAAREPHRVAAARWLARLHLSAAAQPPAARAPDRGAGHYLGHLRSARELIVRHEGNPALDAEDRLVLRAIVAQCELAAARWDEVVATCAASPPTLIHGDFAPKNMRVRSGAGGLELVPFDWGSAGWGSIAPDLVQWSAGSSAPWGYWANPDLAEYAIAVRGRWPQLDGAALDRLATVGKLLRCLVCVALSAQSFATPWVERAARNMRIYAAEMADALGRAGWQRGDAS